MFLLEDRQGDRAGNFVFKSNKKCEELKNISVGVQFDFSSFLTIDSC